MTISNNERKKIHVWDNVVAEFSYPYIQAEADLAVSLLDSDGTVVLEVDSSKYSLSATGAAGICTITDAPTLATVADKILLLRTMDLTQELDLGERDFPPEDVEDAFDKATLIDQQLAEELSRGVQSNILEERTEAIELPVADEGKILIWDGEGNLINGTITAGDALPTVASTYIKRNAGNTAFVTDTQPTTNAANIVTNTADIATNTDAIDNITIDLPKGYINGGVVSNDGTTPDEIINITAVKARSSDDTQDIDVPTGSLDITDSADWAGSVLNSLTIPEMTSNTAPSGTCSSTGMETGDAFNAFDRTVTKIGGNAYTAGGIKTLKYEFDTVNDYIGDYLVSVDVYDQGSVGFTNENIEITYEDLTTSNHYINLADDGITTINITTEKKIKSAELTFTVSSGSTNVGYGIYDFSLTANPTTNASIFVWADYNSGTPRYILDDVTGSNISGVKRRVGSFITDSSGDIIPFNKCEQAGGGIKTLFGSSISEFSGQGTAAWTDTDVTVPPNMVGIFNASAQSTGGTTYYSTIDLKDANGLVIKGMSCSGLQAGVSSVPRNNYLECLVDNNSQIGVYNTSNNAAATSALLTYGYQDERTV